MTAQTMTAPTPIARSMGYLWVMFMASLLTGCPTEEGRPCVERAECFAGEACVNQRCVRYTNKSRVKARPQDDLDLPVPSDMGFRLPIPRDLGRLPPGIFPPGWIPGSDQGIPFPFNDFGFPFGDLGPPADMGPPGDLVIEPESLNFGSLRVNQEGRQLLQVGNIGEGKLTISYMAISEQGSPFRSLTEIREGDAPLRLEPGDTRGIFVSFQPTTQGAKTAVLVVLSNDPLEPASYVSLRGEAN